MAIVECFKHWRHYLEGTSQTIEVWSDHRNLQGFMRQPKINGRQARWLVYLTLYDFIIHHRPGLLNPADGPSRRPDYMVMAQKEPSLLQKDLLVERLAGSNSRVTDIPINPETESRLHEPDRPGITLPEAELHEAARATRRVNAPSPLVDSKGQWASNEGAVGLWTPIATVQVLCALPMAEDSEAGHLLELVRLQAITRREAKKATQGESPLVTKTAPGLLDLILQS